MAAPDWNPIWLINWLIVVVEVVGVPEKPVGVALKALCSSGNLRLAKEGCFEAEKALGAGTGLIAPPPPPVKVEV